jgi:hypothetical protein
MEPGERGGQGGSDGLGGRSGDGQGVEDGVREFRVGQSLIELVWQSHMGCRRRKGQGEFGITTSRLGVYTDIMIHHAFPIHHTCPSPSPVHVRDSHLYRQLPLIRFPSAGED